MKPKIADRRAFESLTVEFGISGADADKVKSISDGLRTVCENIPMGFKDNPLYAEGYRLTVRVKES